MNEHEIDRLVREAVKPVTVGDFVPARIVYEVVVSTDEGYFTVVVTGSREEADALAARGDSLLWDGPRDYLHFEVKEHAVKAVDAAAWSRQDFIDALDHPEPEDWFAPEDDDDRA